MTTPPSQNQKIDVYILDEDEATHWQHDGSQDTYSKSPAHIGSHVFIDVDNDASSKWNDFNLIKTRMPSPRISYREQKLNLDNISSYPRGIMITATELGQFSIALSLIFFVSTINSGAANVAFFTIFGIINGLVFIMMDKAQSRE